MPFLAPVGRPVLQSSANLAGGPDARRLADVPESIRAGADLVIDGGELPGVPSTVIDLRRRERVAHRARGSGQPRGRGPRAQSPQVMRTAPRRGLSTQTASSVTESRLSPPAATAIG